MRSLLFLLPALVLSHLALAGTLEVLVEIPRLKVAEYHRPYVAVWLEKEGGDAVDLALWYKVKRKQGEKWIRELTRYWRRSGRTREFPIDAVSAATHAPGVYGLRFRSDEAPLGELEPGQYMLWVQAVREAGDRELLKVPFIWPAQEQQVLKVSGTSELGEIVLTISP